MVIFIFLFLPQGPRGIFRSPREDRQAHPTPEVSFVTSFIFFYNAEPLNTKWTSGPEYIKNNSDLSCVNSRARFFSQNGLSHVWESLS